jgi:hypothetical protein
MGAEETLTFRSEGAWYCDASLPTCPPKSIQQASRSLLPDPQRATVQVCAQRCCGVTGLGGQTAEM